ncbi:MAG: glycosyltransferase [Candidatus Synoicihabitans palmerolidicus]|nr:glycosyltransferase [Candidatus Synoicihabitans palmerolidicus]
MTSPLVTVVIPLYNGAAFVKEAIDSVLAQDYLAIETWVLG